MGSAGLKGNSGWGSEIRRKERAGSAGEADPSDADHVMRGSFKSEAEFRSVGK